MSRDHWTPKNKLQTEFQLWLRSKNHALLETPEAFNNLISEIATKVAELSFKYPKSKPLDFKAWVPREGTTVVGVPDLAELGIHQIENRYV